MAGELFASGVVTAPGAGAAIATLAAPAAGKYKVTVSSGVSNNAVADLNNLELKRGSSAYITPIPHGANGGRETFTVDEMDLDGSQALSVNAIGAGTAAIEYGATIEALRVG